MEKSRSPSYQIFIFFNKRSILFSSDNVCIILFSAVWAEQCLQIIDVMKELSNQSDFKNFQFIDVEAEEFSDISLKHQV